MKLNIQGFLGAVLMTIAVLVLGGIPLAVDLSPSHVLNPTWPAHARLHEVWLLGTGALLALVMLYFIWVHPDRRFGHALAAVLLSCLAGGFFIASATKDAYGGALIEPLTASQMPMNEEIAGIPVNLFGFLVAWSLGMIGWALTRKSA